MTNLCRDEVTQVLKDKIEAIFGSSFNTNGLGGVLTCGVTGMKAGLSHSPVCGVSTARCDQINACFACDDAWQGVARSAGRRHTQRTACMARKEGTPQFPKQHAADCVLHVPATARCSSPHACIRPPARPPLRPNASSVRRVAASATCSSPSPTLPLTALARWAPCPAPAAQSSRARAAP